MVDTPVLPRPQPVGVFPLPAGYLLIGPGSDRDEARAQLLAGRIPPEFPAELAYYRHALDGDTEAALEAIDAKADHRDPNTVDIIADINRFVLDSSPSRHAKLVEDLDALDAIGAVGADEGSALAAHIAMVAFAVGLTDDLVDPATTDAEFAALAHAARAAVALEGGDRAAAIDELEAGAQAAHPVCPVLAGQLLGQLANAQLDEGDTQRASVSFQAAIDALAGSELYLSRAELHLAAGAMFQEMSDAAPRLLQQAINHYHQALALVTADTAPETVAIANANLGLAYLMMPMNQASDQLRVGVAIQAMRSALDYFNPLDHPDRWSSTQLNLANALVYLPSNHQADNIAEAVGLYEGVLQHRDRQSDPMGRARVLANQGNALAHLGVFEDAKARLHEARTIFEEFDEIEAVQMVRSVLDEVAKEESVARQDDQP